MTPDPGFTTPGMAEIFSAGNRVRLFCRFEAALAAAQAEEALIPRAAAEAIAEACAVEVPDPEGVLARGWEDGTPILPLLEELRPRMAGEYADHLHHGATSQDVIDTATMLQCVTAFRLLDADLADASSRLVVLAGDHRQTPTLAWTLLQPATATTFGVRAARWLQGLVGVRRELAALSGRLPLQLGGPVGDTASLGEAAPAVSRRMAGQLGLAVPPAPWHTDRWPVLHVAGLLAGTSAALSKIASDVALLAGRGAVSVRSGGSSSMSHKRNPLDAIRAEAAAEVCRSAAAGLVTLPSHVLERGMGPWHAEWALLPIAMQSAGAAAEATARGLATLEVATPEEAGAATGTEFVDAVLDDHRSLEEG